MINIKKIPRTFYEKSIVDNFIRIPNTEKLEFKLMFDGTDFENNIQKKNVQQVLSVTPSTPIVPQRPHH